MTTRNIKGLRWWIIGLFMVGTVLSYLTRASLAVAAPTIMGDLKITTEQYGWITGAFQFGLMLSPICGYVLDTIGLKMGLAIFAGGWAVITMAHGLANNWQTFAGLRALMGFAESSAHPSGMKLVSEWFPAKERGLGGGIYNVGASLGSMLAPPLIVWAILAYNWRMAFVLAGAVAVGLPEQFDASILSDEASAPGLPNFTGAFVGVACQDLAGTARAADFDYFEYREREYSARVPE